MASMASGGGHAGLIGLGCGQTNDNAEALVRAASVRRGRPSGIRFSGCQPARSTTLGLSLVVAVCGITLIWWRLLAKLAVV
jgi:hypothetical protein